MSLSDPIGDMIARVKNAQARNHKKVQLTKIIEELSWQISFMKRGRN